MHVFTALTPADILAAQFEGLHYLHGSFYMSDSLLVTDPRFVDDTHGDWRTLANPNGGAPLVDYRGNATDGRETRPHGIPLDQMTQADHVAFQLAEVIASGKTLEEAKAPLQAFTTIVAPVGVAVENMTDEDRAFVEKVNAANTAIGDAALTVLHTGAWQGAPAPTAEPAPAAGSAPTPVVESHPAPAASAAPVAPQTASVNQAPPPADVAPTTEPPALVLTKDAHERTRTYMQVIGDELHLLSDKAKTAFAKLVAELHHL